MNMHNKRHTQLVANVLTPEFSTKLLSSLEDYAIFTTDLNGIITTWTKGAQKLLGYTEKEAVGLSSQIIFTPEDKQKGMFLHEMQTALEKGKALDERWHVKKNGTRFWGNGWVYQLKNEENTVVGFTKIFRDLTQKYLFEQHQKQTAIEQRKIKEQAALIEIANDAFIVLDNKNRILLWNKGAEQIYGYTSEEALGQVAYKLLLTKFPVPFKRLIALLKKQKVWRGELVHTLKNGQRITVDSKWEVVSNGKDFRFLEVNRDITERKRFEKNLRFLSEASKVLSSSLDYKKTLDSVTKLAVPYIADWCSVDMIDENGDVQLVSVAHKDPKKVRWAKELRRLIPVDMNAKQGLPQVLRSSQSEFYPFIDDDIIVKAARNEKELEIIRKIGFTSLIIVPICNDQKCVGAITLVTTESRRRYTNSDFDMAQELSHRVSLAIQNVTLYENAQKEITRRKETEEALIQSKAQMQQLYDANIIGVYYCNVKGTIFDANDAFLNTVGYTRDDLTTGKLNWISLTPPQYHPIDEKAIVELLKTGVLKPWEKEYIRKDGSQVPVIVGATLTDKAKGEAMAFVLDITERKKLEQRKDEFIGIASHELKTPLTSIKGYVQILERIIHQMGDPRLELYLKKTNTYIDRLNTLIADLLDVSKIQAGKLQLNFDTFNIKDLAQDSIESIQHMNSHHKIVLQNAVDIQINGDRQRLEQVFTNLLTNAIKYSPKADTVIVSLKHNEKEVQVSVQDFGVGIPKKEQQKLFQRFYRVESTAKKFSGLGIGLYISCEIVERHGGHMWVESDEGKGSTFYFTLPL